MDTWYLHPNQQIIFKINKHRRRKRWNVHWSYVGFSKLGQLLTLSYTPKPVRLQLSSSSSCSALVLFSFSHFLRSHLSKSLRLLSLSSISPKLTFLSPAHSSQLFLLSAQAIFFPKLSFLLQQPPSSSHKENPTNSPMLP